MLKAGVSKIKITPRPGLEMAGYGVYINRIGKEIHDDLYARALLFDDGRKKALLIVCDLCGIGRHFVVRYRQEISKTIKIPENNISISATHTHSGPVTVYLRGWGEMDKGYMAFLREKILEAAQEANNNLEPVLVGAGIGKVEIGVNRVVKGGLMDTSLIVLRVDDYKGKTKAVFYNYAAHAVVGGPSNIAVSADWPGFASSKIDAALGKGTAVFAQGCCGDINAKDACTSSFEKMKEHGEQLAEEALRIYGKIKPAQNLGVSMRSKLVNLPLRVPDEEFVEGIMSRYAEQRKQPDWERFYREWKEDTLREISRNVRDTLPVEIQVLMLGKDILFAMLPGEVFTKWGLKIKKCSPAKNTFVIGIANDEVGYIPDEDDFARNGYAADMVPVICGFFHFAPNVGETLVAAVRELLLSVK